VTANITTRFLLLSTLILFNSTAWANNCGKGDALYQSAFEESERISVLERVLATCPNHTGALNDLALAYEEKRQFSEAESLYRQAIEVEPSFPPPYAGLGDVLTETGQLHLAVKAYQRFLKLLDEQKRSGSPQEYASHESHYRKRLAEVHSKVSNGSLVTASMIKRSLSSGRATSTTRGMRRVKSDPTPAKIDLSIQFLSGSAQLNSTADAQLGQMALALMETEFQRENILIEGHTDAMGSDQSNYLLSQKRAESVRNALISRGVSAQQLQAVGRGESSPIADNGSKMGRRLNRRVTLINNGRL
jgi:outer membrane protein OmpA-like peptidoglycan-associated protein